MKPIRHLLFFYNLIELQALLELDTTGFDAYQLNKHKAQVAKYEKRLERLERKLK